MKISDSWLKMADIYKLFCSEKRIRWLKPAGSGYETFDYIPEYLDFSDRAKEEAYLYESKGMGNKEIGVFTDKKVNAYLYGKKMLNITVSMWKEDLGKTIFLQELYNDRFPHWWLNKVFNRKEVPLAFNIK